MYFTYVPSRFVLSSGREVRLKAAEIEERLVRKILFRL